MFVEMKTYLDDRLKNWAMYLKKLPAPEPLPDEHCRSIEHKFLAESGEVWEEHQEKVFVDFKDGERVESIVTQLNNDLKKVIKARFILFPHLHAKEVAQKIKMSEQQFETLLAIARQKILLKLEPL